MLKSKKFPCGCELVKRQVFDTATWHRCEAHRTPLVNPRTSENDHERHDSDFLPAFVLGYAISHISDSPAPSTPTVESFSSSGGDFGGAGASGSYDSGSSSDSSSSSDSGSSSGGASE